MNLKAVFDDFYQLSIDALIKQRTRKCENSLRRQLFALKGGNCTLDGGLLKSLTRCKDENH